MKSSLNPDEKEVRRKYTDEQWISDIDSLYTFMTKTHPGLYWKTPRKAFEKMIEVIKSRVPVLSDDQIIAELCRLAALARDGHTVFMGSNLSEKYFPVRIESFRDGFFVTAVSKKYPGIYGLEVTRIGNYDSREAFKKIGTITSSDNSISNLYWSTRNITMSSLLNGLGIIESPDMLDLELTDDKGTRSKITIKAESYPFMEDNFHSWFWQSNSVPDTSYVNLLTQTASNPPLRLQHSDKPYWFELINETKILYFCFNSCESRTEEPFPEFAGKLWRTVEKEMPVKLIIDLRNNLGGTNDYLQSLIQGLSHHDEISSQGHLFVLTSRKTFSAAVHCATWIQNSSQPIFAGEPTGAGPNHFGDPAVYFLPNSKLMILVSSRYWQNGLPNDKSDRIEPKLKFESRSKSYFEGKDEALEYILNMTP